MVCEVMQFERSLCELFYDLQSFSDVFLLPQCLPVVKAIFRRRRRIYDENFHQPDNSHACGLFIFHGSLHLIGFECGIVWKGCQHLRFGAEKNFLEDSQ